MSAREPDDTAAVVARLHAEWVAGRGGNEELTHWEVDAVARALLPAHRRLIARTAGNKGPRRARGAA